MSEWTYRQLCDTLRGEKASNALVPLAADSEEALASLFVSLERAGRDGGADALRELENARKAAASLGRIRRDKIVRRALLPPQSNDYDGLSRAEQAMLGRVRDLCRQEDARLDALVRPSAATVDAAQSAPKAGAAAAGVWVGEGSDSKLGRGMATSPGAEARGPAPASGSDRPAPPAGAAPEGRTEERPGPGAKAGPRETAVSGGEAPASGGRRLRILKAVEAYMGPDAQEYGPFAAGDEVELPEGEARALVAGQMAQEL